MRDGERADEEVSSAAPFPCDIPDERESDGEDELSNYSSCGESEFEKYCSASSAMGTPSFRSGSCQDSDFGPLKTFSLGDEITNFKNFGADKKLSGFGEFEGGTSLDKESRRSFDLKDNGILDFNAAEGFAVNGSVGVGCWENCGAKKNLKWEISDEFREIKDGNGHFRELERSDHGEGIENLGDRVSIASDEDEASSRRERSDGEDSMFGCGSDDNSKIDAYYRKSATGGKSGTDENKLGMSSQVAFGYNDWDDFIQENVESNVASLWGDLQGEKQHNVQSVYGKFGLYAAETDKFPGISLAEAQHEVRGTHLDSVQAQATSYLTENSVNALSMGSTSHVTLNVLVNDVKEVLISGNQVQNIYKTAEHHKSNSGCYLLELDEDPPTKKALEDENLKIHQAELENKHNYTVGISSDVSIEAKLGKINIEIDPLSECVIDQRELVPMKDIDDAGAKLFIESKPLATMAFADASVSGQTKKNSGFSLNQIEDHFHPVKKREIELNDIYGEIVDDMEDILLDAADSSVSIDNQGNRTYHSQFSSQSRDGGSSASTSDADYAYNCIQQSLKIDRIEVVGARQIEGDVSLAERLVGIKKYTVYKISVWSREKNWEVERRYRDFNALYHQLKKLFVVDGCMLPSPWYYVDRESRKLFGNASPDVIADRSTLIQDCIKSVLGRKLPPSSLDALICFLSPSELVPDILADNPNVPMSPFSYRSSVEENFYSLGKTISLIVHIIPFKSTKQMLDIQHYKCANCHRNFGERRTRVQEYFEALGWSKPRLCEYTGQLFCSSCHSNDTAVLPARVLHHWDFTPYPVSQIAKSYLDSIYDKPMLCLSAINLSLFSKVPALQHVANTRNRIRVMLPYVRCPFRRSIDRGLGSHDYLVASNDFFSLRDLIDLSKGIFSALPVMVETMSRKIREHIMEQCLVCYDVGITCNARLACNSPLSLIFPFQEDDVEKCMSCKLVFHEKCFKTIASCPCGARFKQDIPKQTAGEGGQASSSGLLSGFLSKVTPRKSFSHRKEDLEGVDNVIVMSSLTNSSL